jgi:hypothetical protein
MMVSLELKEHKGFRVHKVRFKDIRELVVPKEPQVTSELMAELKVLKEVSVSKGLKEPREHKVD